MITNKEDYKEYLSADKLALGRSKAKPSVTDVIWRYEILLRKCEYYNNCHPKSPLTFYYKFKRHRLGVKCNYTIPLNSCGKGLCIAHVGPIVISNLAHIGDNCRIHIDVNIGADARDGKLAPKIGNNVYIAPGAKIFGGVTIADNIAIGANSVVNKSFEEPGISIGGCLLKRLIPKVYTILLSMFVFNNII